MEIDPIKIAKSNDKQTAHIQFTIILVDPESSKSQRFIGSPLIKWIELIAEIYPPKPKKAACPNETKPPYPNTRLRPIPAIPKITIFVIENFIHKDLKNTLPIFSMLYSNINNKIQF